MDSDFDIHEARRASSYRLLDVWSHLAERHSRRLNDDDIIDVFTGEVVRDRGVLRNSFQQYDIGYFADAQAGNNNDDASSEGDKDELDVLAEQADISGELEERERLNRNVPPVQVMDPADAEDLREFLEAERKRKEIWGCEEEESSASDDLAEARNREDNLEEAGDVNDAGNGDSEEEEEEDLEHSAPQDVLGDHEIPLNDTARHHTGDIHRPTDEESDDELGTWDFDEGNIVYQVPRNEIRGDNIIESSKNSHSPDPIIISSSPQARIPNPIWMHARALKRKRVLSEDLSVDGTMDSSKEGPNMGETSTLGALDPELEQSLYRSQRRSHSRHTVSSAKPGQIQVGERSHRSHSHLKSYTPQLRKYSSYQHPSQSDTNSNSQDQRHTYYPAAPFTPVQDPRVQLIISQAVHQISSLVNGGTPDPSQPQYLWPQQQLPHTYPVPPCQNPHWPPYPSHHHTHTGSISSSSSQHSVPPSSFGTPSHPRPYPYTSSPLPPSSPDRPSSSPPCSRVVETHAKSLVRRSKSRGRRVSFRIEHGRSLSGGTSRSRSLSMTTDSREWEVESDVSPPPRRGRSRSVKVVDQVEMDPGPIARGRSKRDGLSCPKPMSSKVKARVKVQEDAGESDDLSDRRLAAVRGQTPGPPSWRPSTRRGKLT